MPACKPAHMLRPQDLAEHPVWRYKAEERLLAHEDESWVEPADPEHVHDAYGHFFATTVILPDQAEVVALVGSTDPVDPSYNQTSQFFVFFHDDKQLRWHPEENLAEELAIFLSKPVEATVPFQIDITRYLVGDPASLTRKVWARRHK
jgi:hypothetical protein